MTKDEIKEQIVAWAKDWARRYDAIANDESDAEYSDVDFECMSEVLDYARELLGREGAV